MAVESDVKGDAESSKKFIFLLLTYLGNMSATFRSYSIHISGPGTPPPTSHHFSQLVRRLPGMLLRGVLPRVSQLALAKLRCVFLRASLLAYSNKKHFPVSSEAPPPFPVVGWLGASQVSGSVRSPATTRCVRSLSAQP